MKEVLQRAGTMIRAWGYQGSGQNYRRHAGDVIFVINFQKSRSGDYFFVNFGGQPTEIPDEGENEPNAKTLKEYECVFRHRLRGEWSVCVSPAQIDALLADVDATRRTFERKVDEMRELSRQGRGRDLRRPRVTPGRLRARLSFSGAYSPRTATRAPLVSSRSRPLLMPTRLAFYARPPNACSPDYPIREPLFDAKARTVTATMLRNLLKCITKASPAGVEPALAT